MATHSNAEPGSELRQLRKQVILEQQARLDAEERIRAMLADHNKLEIDLIRYRDHFESQVALRVAQLMANNGKLVQENGARRLSQREPRSFQDRFSEASLMLETMLNAIPDIIGVQDTSRRIIRFNRAGYKFFGLDEDQAVGKRCFELINQCAPCDNCVARQILCTSKPAQAEKYIDSKGVWMDIRAYPILDIEGRVIRIVEHWRDITDIKANEASLVESEEKYRLLVENANEGIFIFQNGDFRFSNHKAREMAHKLGLAVLRKPLIDYVFQDDRRDDPDAIMRRLNGGDPKPSAVAFRLIDPENELIWIEMNTINIRWKGAPATLNFVKDITQSKALERRFQESQRLESLGTLAGGIAHDFNNLLMGIQGNVSLMYLDAEHDPAITEKLKNIEDCVDSGARLTKQLLGFARGGKYVVKAMDMNQIMQSSAEMFGRTRKTIKIHEEYQKELWTVMADGSQIEQVLVNLFLNAWQAMHGSGDLFLRTANVVLNDAFVGSFDIPPGRYVQVSVKDTGIGMDETTQRRIFEPFFTTQEPGRGTGLGLASVFGIIKNHNGTITVKSRPGQGSHFDIYLPASDKNPEVDAPPKGSIELGSETILLVDDEEYIIDVARLMLEGLGYTLLIANSGASAINCYAEKNEAIDLVILDMVMPDMDGEEVYGKLRDIRPDIKVIFASGYYDIEQAKALLAKGRSGFLQKPFNMQQLSTKIRGLLDKPRTI